MTSRRFCFTIFDVDCVPYLGGDVRYLVYSIERCPKSDKLHLQGYCELSKALRGSYLQKLWKSKFHYEKCKGSVEDNFNYCSKEPLTRFYEFGEPGKQGQRTDIGNAVEMLKEGKDYLSILNEFPDVYIKYHRGLEKANFLLQAVQAKVFRKLHVEVLRGHGGKGKTRKYLYKEDDSPVDEDIYIVNQPDVDGAQLWWDGYEGQKTILIDEFYGWIRWSKFLRILDGHKLRLQVKGGFRWALYTKVIITSNNRPSTWYPSKGFPYELERRITEIKDF